MNYVKNSTLSDRRRLRRAVSLISFLGALTVYLLTLEPDASFWDCPEYLVTAIRMEVGHPPGNPFWTLTARIFSLFGGGNPAYMAWAVNASSALFTALAAALLGSSLFLLFSIISPGRKHGWAKWVPAIASLSGALTFAWSDSPWFSAVEAEVYAFSLFLTALSVRLMLGWALTPDRSLARRELILIAYLLGLSIGVHQLNLLTIPALAMIWLFRRHRKPVGFWRFWATLIGASGMVGIILLGMMPGVLSLSGILELWCVNTLHLPYHSGIILFWLIAICITWGIPMMMQGKRRFSPRTVTLSWIPAMLLTGYACYMLIPLRAAAMPAMNEGAPTDIFSLSSYLGRDQYGSTPLFYGRTPYSRPMRIEEFKADSTPTYSKIAREYRHNLYTRDTASAQPRYHCYDRASKVIYTPELNMLLPRITSADAADIACYADWAGMTSGTMTPVEVSYAFDAAGKPVGKLGSDGKRFREMEMRPTYWQNLKYLAGYQISYMYLRYLLWNFAGKQNDRFATGEVEHANFITGFPVIDDAMLGPQSALPKEIGSENKGHNRYFLLPLLFGILGMFVLQSRGRIGDRANTVITVLFLMTGMAIVFYLNQSPREPRERDYSFLGSFWAFAVWISAGVYGMLAWYPKRWRFMSRLFDIPVWRKVYHGLALAIAIFIPLWMLGQNYDDHDRSGRRGVTDFSANLLESLEPNAILFTNGDNFTFPLWWAQEVCGIRRDVTVINTAYLSTPWYVKQLLIPGEGRAPLIMQSNPNLLGYGDLNVSYYKPSPLIPTLQDSIGAVDALTAIRLRSAKGRGYHFPPLLRIAIPGDTDSLYIRSAAVASASSYMSLRQLAALDIIASNAASPAPRPVYWQSSLSAGDYAGTYPFTTRTLHTRRLVYNAPDDTISAILENDYVKGLQSRSGMRPEYVSRGVYADATFGPMITAQRVGLLRLGGRLLNAGRPKDAMRIARVILWNYPPEIWEFQNFYESDSACYEGTDLARLLLESSRRVTPVDTATYNEGLRLLDREYVRYKEWTDYRNTLPPYYRNVLTPKNLRKTLMLPYVDSLRQVYKSVW